MWIMGQMCYLGCKFAAWVINLIDPNRGEVAGLVTRQFSCGITLTTVTQYSKNVSMYNGRKVS
jgi:hypothetical protein